MQPTWWYKGVQCGLQFWDMREIGCPNPWCTSKQKTTLSTSIICNFAAGSTPAAHVCTRYLSNGYLSTTQIHHNIPVACTSCHIQEKNGGKKKENWWVFLTILWVLGGEFCCSFQLCWWGHGRIASTWKLVPRLDALMLLHCCCCSTQRCRAAQTWAHIIYLWWIDSPLLLAFSTPAHSQISQILYLRDMNCA